MGLEDEISVFWPIFRGENVSFRGGYSFPYKINRIQWWIQWRWLAAWCPKGVLHELRQRYFPAMSANAKVRAKHRGFGGQKGWEIMDF